MYESIDEIKNANATCGGNWFTSLTALAWQRTPVAGPYDGRFFIASESRPPIGTRRRGPRTYIVCEATKDGTIMVHGPQPGHLNFSDAVDVVKRMVSCDACHGHGALWPRSTFDNFTRPGPEWVQIERCDLCSVYEGDFEAGYTLAGAAYVASDPAGRMVVWVRADNLPDVGKEQAG